MRRQFYLDTDVDLLILPNWIIGTVSMPGLGYGALGVERLDEHLKYA